MQHIKLKEQLKNNIFFREEIINKGKIIYGK